VPPAGKPAEQDGQVYAPAGAGCSVVMPKGEVKTQTIAAPGGGKVTAHILIRGTAMYSLAVTEAPANMGKGEQLLKAALEKVTQVVPGAKISDQKPVMVDGHPGRDLAIELPGFGQSRERLVVVGGRIYEASVMGSREAITSPEAERFRQSLKILTGAK
jgi:hypothetical protein